jgi:First Longin domain of FUZ, MON1 and HPS1/Second Longin domain of FUZ, MON1 and HPS1
MALGHNDSRTIGIEESNHDAGRIHLGNVLALSDAGKPIFVWRENDDGATTSRLCGLVQAVYTSIRHSDLQEDIQSLEAGSLLMVFMTVGSILLVATSTLSAESSTKTTDSFETTAYLRMQLEYLYAQIILNFTDQIQSIFVYNAGFDLRGLLLGSGEAMMRTILEEAMGYGEKSGPAPFVTAGVPVFRPLSYAARDRASAVLQQVGGETVQTFAALLMVGPALVTLVQSSYSPHQLKSVDLNLVLHFVHRQQINSELWLPLCLPRFNSAGFMHCYVHCLDMASKLTLVLMSQDGSTEQFQVFRAASARIRRCLGIPVEDRSILEILDSSGIVNESSDTQPESSKNASSDVQWRRNSSISNEKDFEEDYEMVSHFEDGTSISGESFIRLLQSEQETSSRGLPVEEALLLEFQHENGSVGLLHFCFRSNVAILPEHYSKSNNPGSMGRLTQCLAPDVPFATKKRHVWSAYQRLHLRLRLGSASACSMFSACQLANDIAEGSTSMSNTGKYFRTMLLSESIPSIEGFAYLSEGSETFLAMNGRGFEL